MTMMFQVAIMCASLSVCALQLLAPHASAFEDDSETSTGSADDTYASCPDNCLSYNDGCNTCSCDAETGRMLACTEMACLTMGTPYCEQCDSNFEWVGVSTGECGDPCWQQETCYPEDYLCITMCQDQCQCPTGSKDGDALSVYDCRSHSCIASDECPSEDDWDSARDGYGCEANGTDSASASGSESESDSESESKDSKDGGGGVNATAAVNGTAEEDGATNAGYVSSGAAAQHGRATAMGAAVAMAVVIVGGSRAF